MKILVIDGQGGKLGRQLAESIMEKYPSAEICVVGANTIATAAMMKSGAQNAATGQNAVRVCAAEADVIIGPIGIVIADSMMGEITPMMALAVARSRAKKILIPMNKCNNLIAGVTNMPMSALISDALKKLDALIEETNLP